MALLLRVRIFAETVFDNVLLVVSVWLLPMRRPQYSEFSWGTAGLGTRVVGIERGLYGVFNFTRVTPSDRA